MFDKLFDRRKSSKSLGFIIIIVVILWRCHMSLSNWLLGLETVHPLARFYKYFLGVDL